MILVGGVPLFMQMAGVDAEELIWKLLNHPLLRNSANAFATTPPLKFRGPRPSGNDSYNPNYDIPDLETVTTPNFVYLFQKEYAAVSPSFAQIVGTDDLTTCVALVMRDPASGLTGLGHIDSVHCVARGVEQLVDSVISAGCGTIQVHMMGAFDDSGDYQDLLTDTLPSVPGAAVGLMKEDFSRHRGYSWPLAIRLINILQSSVLNFEIETCFILKHNTIIGSHGHPIPVFRGCMVETMTGAFSPAKFEEDAQGPDRIVRQVCGATVHRSPGYVPALISSYTTSSDTFSVSPVKWDTDFSTRHVPALMSLSDEMFLHEYSTSPHAEGPKFVASNRSVFRYLMTCPLWEQTFPGSLPRVFRRSALGGWIRVPATNL